MLRFSRVKCNVIPRTLIFNSLKSHEISRYVFWYRWIAQKLLPLPARFRFFKKSILCRIFDFLGLGASSFCSAQISAQCMSGAHFVSTDVHMVPLSHSWTWLKYYYIIKSEPRTVSNSTICTLSGAHVAPDDLVQSYKNFKVSPGRTLSKLYLLLRWSPIFPQTFVVHCPVLRNEPPKTHWAEIRALRKLLAPRPKNLTQNRL
jgi:hypothetical protein